MTRCLGLALLMLFLLGTSACGSSAGGDDSVVLRTAREDYFEIRSLLTGDETQSWWQDLRGTRLPPMGLWVVASDVDWEPPVLRLGPDKDGPAEVTVRLDDVRDWNGAVGDEILVSGVARTLRLNPFHLILDEGIVTPIRPTNADRGPRPSASLSIEPAQVVAGEAVTIRWESENARSAKLNQGIGNVELTGSRAMRPSQTTTYMVSVRGAGGEASASATVTVR